MAKVFTPGTHASTFGGNPLATTASKYVIETITENGFLEEVEEKGAYFKEKLISLKEKYSCIKDVRGIGLMLGVQIEGNVGEIVKKAMDLGLLIVGAGQSAIRFVPALIVSKDEIDQALEIFEKALS